MRIAFETADGHRTEAPPASIHYDVKGRAFVWVRTRAGDIRKAYQRSEV